MFCCCLKQLSGNLHFGLALQRIVLAVILVRILPSAKLKPIHTSLRNKDKFILRIQGCIMEPKGQYVASPQERENSMKLPPSLFFFLPFILSSFFFFFPFLQSNGRILLTQEPLFQSQSYILTRENLTRPVWTSCKPLQGLAGLYRKTWLLSLTDCFQAKGKG